MADIVASTTKKRIIWTSRTSLALLGFCYSTSILVKKEQAYVASLNEEQLIEYKVGKLLSGKASTGRQRFQYFEIKKEDDGYIIKVQFNADEYSTPDSMRKAVEIKMSEIYMIFYDDGSDVKQARVTAFFPYVDKYGDVGYSQIYDTELNRDEAQKINWNEDDAYLQTMILPKVWRTIYMSSMLGL